MAKPATYPPEHHVNRDLAPTLERDASGSTISIPIVPEIRDGSGRLRLGVAATIVDIVAGETAIRAVQPGWVATSTLSLQIDAMPSEGTLRARPQIRRQGRTTLVQEVALDHPESGAAVGLSTIGFSILPSRNPEQSRVDWMEKPAPKTVFGDGRNRLGKPLLEALGVRFDPRDPKIARVDTGEYVVNTLGAMQGGVVATFLEAAAERFAEDQLGGPAWLRSLELHYLALAKGGPLRAETRILGHLRDGLLLRVELRDEGAEDRLTTLGTLVADAGPT